MARKRIEGTQFDSFEDVDQALRDIGELDRELAMFEASQNEAIDTIKGNTKGLTAPLVEKKAALESAIKEFCEANRAEFTKVKTKELTFGSVGFRISTSIMIKRVAETLQSLKDLALTGCIRTKEELDKEAMNSLPDATLAEVGAARRTTNAFGYTLNVERIREAA